MSAYFKQQASFNNH